MAQQYLERKKWFFTSNKWCWVIGRQKLLPLFPWRALHVGNVVSPECWPTAVAQKVPPGSRHYVGSSCRCQGLAIRKEVLLLLEPGSQREPSEWGPGSQTEGYQLPAADFSEWATWGGFWGYGNDRKLNTNFYWKQVHCCAAGSLLEWQWQSSREEHVPSPSQTSSLPPRFPTGGVA